MKWKIWHIDAVGGIILAGLIAVAYFYDSPRSIDNAIKPVTCVAGDPNSNWICPGEERVIQVPVKPGANL